MKTTGKYLKAWESGYLARGRGDKLPDNPNKFGPDVQMSLWWKSGWMAADRDIATGEGK